MTLGQLNVCGAIYHIRMDHQPPSQFLSLPHPQGLSNVLLNQHDHVNKPGYPLSYAMVANHRTAGALVPDTATSDIRSMSVDPGSLDGQVSSQGSGEGSAMEASRKKGEFSGGMGGVEVMVVSSSSYHTASGFKSQKSNVRGHI